MTKAILWAGALALAAVGTCAAAGPLDPPPGPIASTPGPEARTPVSASTTPGDGSAQFAITVPGSYYVTGNISASSARSAIRISAPGVDLDLNGFSLVGAAGSVSGVQLSGAARVRIHGGVITAFGSHGVSAVGSESVVVQDLIVELCGGNGLDIGNGARVERCTARQNAATGIRLGSGSSASACTSSGNATGVEINGNSRVVDCSISTNTVRGILAAGSDGVVEGNLVSQSALTTTAVSVTGSRIWVRNNSISGSGSFGQVGLSVTGTNNVIAENLVRDCPDNYSIAGQPNQVSLIVSQVPETLDFPCSAVLGGALTATTSAGGITIAADGVSLDLNGQELSGTGTSGTGVSSSGARRGVVVRNGSVRGFSSGGINLTSCVAPQVIGVRASANAGGPGISVNGGQVLECESAANTGVGISAGDHALVSRCTATGNSGDNILVGGSSTVENCVANASTGGHGINTSFIFCTVSNCSACGNALSGIRLQQRSRATECTAYNNTLHGVHVTFLGTVERCTVGNSGGNGIFMDAGGGVEIKDNVVYECSNSGTAGIKLTVGLSRVERNQVIGCWRSFDILAGGNMIAGNSSNAVGAGGHYGIAAGNAFGPIVVVGGAGDITGVAGSNHPQANFSY